MTSLNIRASVRLEESIVLSTKGNPEYSPATWTLPNGHEATVTLDVPSSEIARIFGEKTTADNWWVNSRVDRLLVAIRLHDVSEDAIQRLNGIHATAASFVGNGEEHQEAPQLGDGVARDITDLCNTVIRTIRVDYGQYWLKSVQAGDSIQQFLLDANVEWRDAAGVWQTLWVTPLVIRFGHISLGAADRYLQVNDWKAVVGQLSGAGPLAGFSLISDARQKFHEGEVQIAIIHLNSALEWAVQEFLETQLASVLPEETLRNVLKQSHGRLLNDWVLPLVRKLEIDLATNEWPSIKRIQELRATAAHPTVGTGLADVTDQLFARLVRDATTAIAKLLGSPYPKDPPPLAGQIGAGTVRR